jgi:hypothetical protein
MSGLLGPSGKHFLTLTVHYFYGLISFPICQIHITNYVLKFYLYVNTKIAYNSGFRFFYTLNCQYSLFSNKIPIIRILCLSGYFAVQINPDKLSSTAYIYQPMFIKRIKLRVIYTHNLSYVHVFRRIFAIFSETIIQIKYKINNFLILKSYKFILTIFCT